jgi:di/tricarboxylate transporter
MAWMDFGWQGWLTLFTLFAVLSLLITDRASPDIACLGGLALLLVTGVVDVSGGLAGFSNEGVLTVAALFVVASGLYQSGGLRLLTNRLFSSVRGLRRAMARLTIPAAFASGFLNNTPIVALLIPGTTRWSRDNDIDPARLLIPLSYAAILGGTCTLIGTSTNLVVDGLLRESGHEGFSFFAITAVGLPVAIVGLLFLFLVGPHLLPRDARNPEIFGPVSFFTTEVTLPADSPHLGKTLGEISVGELEGIAPIGIVRKSVLLPAPGPTMPLAKGDRLIFSAPAAAVLQVHRFPGFTPASGTTIDDGLRGDAGHVYEAVLSQRCPLVGSIVGDGSFRRQYGAAVLALARQGERIEPESLEDWQLRAGDVVLLEAGEGFDVKHLGREVFVIADHKPPPPLPGHRGPLSVLVALAMIAAAVLELLTIFQAAAAAAALTVAFGILTPADARKSLDWQVLLTIAAAFGIANALRDTGVAASIAEATVALGPGPWITLALFYLTTVLMTESITNNAAAALMFPFGLTIAQSLEVSPIPFAVATMIAASASFATPLGYQTNLMVYGAGNYRFRDFLKIGLPMSLVVGATAIAIIPRVFPF